MKLLQKKLNKPFRHVYTEDDYKWVGRKNNYQITIRRKTENGIKFWFFIEDKNQNGIIFDSIEENIYFTSMDDAAKSALEFIIKRLH